MVSKLTKKQRVLAILSDIDQSLTLFNQNLNQTSKEHILWIKFYYSVSSSSYLQKTKKLHKLAKFSWVSLLAL